MQDEVRWTLRLPRWLRDEARRLAEQDHRSLNGQIVALLEAAVNARAAAGYVQGGLVQPEPGGGAGGPGEA